jgi:hypothetical protein
VTSARVVFDDDEVEWLMGGVGIGTCGVAVRLFIS